MTFGLYPLLVCFIPRPEALPDLRLGTRGSPFPRLSEHLLSPPTPQRACCATGTAQAQRQRPEPLGGGDTGEGSRELTLH